MFWTDLTFIADYNAVGIDTQYHDTNGEALTDPVYHKIPLQFFRGDKIHCGVESNDGNYSLEIENIGKYGTVWIHGVPPKILKFAGVCVL